MRILITGASGQLGSSLRKTVPPEHEVRALTRAQLDVSREDRVKRAFAEFPPQVVLNAAAYSAVDKAETDKARAFAVNADGPEYLARAARQTGARLIHVSTDFVFDGMQSRPYRVSDARHPLSVYGTSKAQGEERVQAVLGEEAVIIRTGWLYAVEDHNFVKTILRLLAERDALNVIADQVGTPTWAMSLAGLTWVIVKRPEIGGLLHWSDAGVASWYDFAVAIQEEAMNLGLVSKAIPIRPVATEDYPLPAKRPCYSVLEKQDTTAQTGVAPSHWRANLRLMLQALSHA